MTYLLTFCEPFRLAWLIQEFQGLSIKTEMQSKNAPISAGFAGLIGTYIIFFRAKSNPGLAKMNRWNLKVLLLEGLHRVAWEIFESAPADRVIFASALAGYVLVV